MPIDLHKNFALFSFLCIEGKPYLNRANYITANFAPLGSSIYIMHEKEKNGKY